MFPIFKNYPGLLAEISQISDGNMKVWADSLKNEKDSLENRAGYFSKLGIEKQDVVNAELAHSDEICVVAKMDGGKFIPEADALITNSKNVFLSVTVADCLPLFLFDPKREALGLIHAGWRGLEKNIIAQSVTKMQAEFGSAPADILAVIGPGICAEHYEVGEELARVFEKYTDALQSQRGKIFLDLKKVALEQLLTVGVALPNIEVSKECTFSVAQKYFSYRRDRPEKVQAMMAVFGMRW